ncbi:hypothetical protein [uncultured Tenacibaculum sp.]|uniref:hypothetical protein n=1 Tax=uncultured Tenacibaculum sp. TaxID=174713 RepID=UPI002605923C|nr:hypothetical protein [uncultured Tenacibaculum sp.]
MQSKSQLFVPSDLTNKKEQILNYYKNQYSFEECKAFIYGGINITVLFNEILFEIIDEENLIVNVQLLGNHHKNLKINNISFRQLTVESSNNFLENPKKGWKNLSTQQRLEICQQELSRWSLILKENNVIFGKAAIENHEEFSHIEIINNCTTSEGFELKLKLNNELYHGSFNMPCSVYNKLCEIQAGSHAKQGWYVNWDRTNMKIEKDHGLIDHTTYPHQENNPAFSQIYWEAEAHTRSSVKIDLDIYRTVLNTISSGNITINFGEINYNRWDEVLGNGNEYYTKPHVRKLIGDKVTFQFKEPPVTYEELYNDSYNLLLPLFLQNGLYDITSLKEKDHYSQLAHVNSFQLLELENQLHEIVLVNVNANDRELHKIVLGNIDINSIPEYPNFLTIDRFCFSPRPTKSYYDKNWKPSSIINQENTMYSFLLTNENSFIQPEGWGIERAILSKNNGNIVIDLISYERILPLWQGELNMNQENV